MTKRNVNIVHKVEAAWNDNKVDKIGKFFAEGYLSHAGIPGMPATLDTAKMAHGMSLAAMPDRKVEILDTIDSGDKVVVRCLVTGTNTGGFPWFGAAANGAKVAFEWISIYRLDGGKIVDHWSAIDTGTLLAQIGAFVPPPMPAPPQG